MDRNLFYKFYWKLKSVIAPTLKNSQYKYAEVLREHSNLSYRWLDLGCGHQLLPSWMPEQEKKVKELIINPKLIVGIDYDLHSLLKNTIIRNKLRGDITKLPLKNESFDLISSNMVFEHLCISQKNVAVITVHFGGLGMALNNACIVGGASRTICIGVHCTPYLIIIPYEAKIVPKVLFCIATCYFLIQFLSI